MRTPRVIVAIEPLIHRETLAFSLEQLRPRARVSLLDPTDDPAGEVGHAGGRLDVEICADGSSRYARDVRVGHVLEDLEAAEERFVSGRLAHGA